MTVKNKNINLRPNANLVLDVLQKERRPISAYEILNELHSEGVHAPATVYRSLKALIKKGLVRKIQTFSRYILVGGGEKNKCVLPLVICTRCEKVFTPSDPELCACLESFGLKFLGQIDQASLEITGVCPECLARILSTSSQGISQDNIIPYK